LASTTLEGSLDMLAPIIYFAAQSLRTKIGFRRFIFKKKYFSLFSHVYLVYDSPELNIDARRQLKNVLIHLISKYETLKSVRTQLCLALVDIVIQLPPQEFSVSDWTTQFQNSPIILMELV
jgi:hypothetical protein